MKLILCVSVQSRPKKCAKHPKIWEVRTCHNHPIRQSRSSSQYHPNALPSLCSEMPSLFDSTPFGSWYLSKRFARNLRIARTSSQSGDRTKGTSQEQVSNKIRPKERVLRWPWLRDDIAASLTSKSALQAHEATRLRWGKTKSDDTKSAPSTID